jgi:hypothetical protein
MESKKNSTSSPRRTAVTAAVVAAIATALVSGALVGWSTQTATAYNDYDVMPCTWPYTYNQALQITYRDNPSYPPIGDYAAAMSSARSSWNGTNTPVNFTYSPSGSSLHAAAYLGTGYFGIMYPDPGCYSTGTLSSAGVWINRTLHESGPYTHIFWKQFTAAHELGHNIALGHSTHSGPTIMQGNMPPSSFRTTAWPNGGYNGPVQDDECGVNSRYPSISWPPTCGY